MKCRQARKRISRYLDNELGPGEKDAFASHIRNCAVCREELEETRAVHQMFVAADRFSAPHAFATRVLANLEAEEPIRQSVPSLRTYFWRTAEIAIAVGVVAIGLVSGNLLLQEKMPLHRQATVQESFSLDLFQATPPDSIGGIYLARFGGTQ